MKIQFDLGQKSHERHQTTVISALAGRGHEVVKTACTADCPGLVEHRLPTDDHRNLLAFSAFVRDDEWGPTIYMLRTVRDYLRYVRPEHKASNTLRHRARNMLAIGYDAASATRARPWLELLDEGGLDAAALEALDRSLAAMEELVPPHPAIVEHVRRQAIDIFCVTPMLMTQYGQTDLVKAVKALDIPVVFLAGSWDNLTTKGTTHVVPDVTLVWNEIQIEEAERFHAIPRRTVEAVGAPRFDEFWERRIEISYDRHCAEFGFDSGRATITYLGSSNLIVKDEIGFVRQWIARIRAADVPEVAGANILLRPHPKFAAGWSEAFAAEPRVGLSLSKILNNDASLYHAMAHSRAVVGANTSAELEAAILGCPVFTIKDPTFVSGQDSTIHFGYLAGDLARVADSLEEHVQQLCEEMGQPRQVGRNDAFLRAFLRPKGLERRASDATADAIEAAARREPRGRIAAADVAPVLAPASGSHAALPPIEVPPATPAGRRGFLGTIKSTARILTGGR